MVNFSFLVDLDINNVNNSGIEEDDD